MIRQRLSRAAMRRFAFYTCRLFFLLVFLAPAAGVGAQQAALPPGVTLRDSPAEKRLLAEFAADRAGGQWLFEAALAANGDLDETSLACYRLAWHEWLTTLRQTTLECDPRQRAEAIFEYLHRQVLGGEYQADCTDLARTIAGDGYNCVGATVLFNSLAQALGLQVHAIETPEHVYSVVTTASGPVEIEMTCRRWFEVIDDRAQRRALIEQTLGKPAPKQAAARRVSVAGLVALVYYNAGVDALAAERFADAAAFNVKALRLDPANLLARGNLMATLNNWALARARRREYAGAVELLAYGRRMDSGHEPFRANLIALYQRWFDDLTERGRMGEAHAVLSRARRELPGEKFSGVVNQSR